MAIGITGSDSQARVQEQYTSISPWCEKSPVFRRRGEAGVLLLEQCVDVFERWRGCGGWSNRKAEAMGLVGPVIRVLTKDNDFYCGEWSMTRPGLGSAEIRALRKPMYTKSRHLLRAGRFSGHSRALSSKSALTRESPC